MMQLRDLAFQKQKQKEMQKEMQKEKEMQMEKEMHMEMQKGNRAMAVERFY